MESVKTIIITGGGGDLGQSVARWWAKPEARHRLDRLREAAVDPC
jgi:hypothetical protein